MECLPSIGSISTFWMLVHLSSMLSVWGQGQPQKTGPEKHMPCGGLQPGNGNQDDGDTMYMLGKKP